MKKVFYLLTTVSISLSAVSCMNEWDGNDNAANYASNYVTSPEDVGSATMTISEFKEEYNNLFTQSNSFELLKDTNDIIIEGIVVANDKSGNLYQSVYLAEETSEGMIDPTVMIQLALKNTCLWPYYQIGQKVRVKVNDLYIGCYSYVPKIGQPYYTSKGNLRLGPVLMETAKDHVYLDGAPEKYALHVAPLELTENDAILTDKKNQNYQHCPMYVTVEGCFELNDTTKHLGDYDEHDDGYGVNRDFKIGSTTIAVRTSTQNEVSYISLPASNVKCRLTGILTYYSGWQLQLCDKSCFQILVNKDNN